MFMRRIAISACSPGTGTRTPISLQKVIRAIGRLSSEQNEALH
jgi:hypothetical protein